MNELKGWTKRYPEGRWLRARASYHRRFFRKLLVVAYGSRRVKGENPDSPASYAKPWQYRVVDPATDAVLGFDEGFATAEGAASAAMILTRLL